MRHDDGRIRFEHPTERKVIPTRDGSGFFIFEPDNLDGIPGAETITILPNKDSRTDDMALREIASRHVSNSSREQTKLIGSLSSIILPGGRCISYQLERLTPGGCVVPGGKKDVCHALSLRSECETSQKVRFEIDSGAEAYPEAGKPSARAREQIKVFERVVKSIEFK